MWTWFSRSPSTARKSPARMGSRVAKVPRLEPPEGSVAGALAPARPRVAVAVDRPAGGPCPRRRAASGRRRRRWARRPRRRRPRAACACRSRSGRRSPRRSAPGWSGRCRTARRRGRRPARRRARRRRPAGRGGGGRGGRGAPRWKVARAMRLARGRERHVNSSRALRGCQRPGRRRVSRQPPSCALRLQLPAGVGGDGGHVDRRLGVGGQHDERGARAARRQRAARLDGGKRAGEAAGVEHGVHTIWAA